MNITLCDKDLKGDVPRFEFESKGLARQSIFDWLMTKDFFSSVFVCFPNHKTSGYGNDCREEQTEILVSHNDEEILDMVERLFFFEKDLSKIDFAIFEFGSYEEAFKYCIDLKEGF